MQKVRMFFLFFLFENRACFEKSPRPSFGRFFRRSRDNDIRLIDDLHRFCDSALFPRNNIAAFTIIERYKGDSEVTACCGCRCP